MKKAILILIVVGMFGWAVYEFVISSNGNDIQKVENEFVISPNGNNAQKVEGKVAESNEIGIRIGQLAPDFELKTLDGETVKLSDYKGQRVMLNFWATWCPPCRAEMPDMQKFQENKDVQVLAVNLHETESDPDNVQEFIDELKLTLTVPLDEKSAVSNHYQIMAYPTSFMIDSNGRIQSIVMGALNYDFMVQKFEMMQ